MAILDGILGGGENSNVSASSQQSDNEFATSPDLGLGLSDVLQSDSFESDGNGGDTEANSFSGIGDLNLDLSSPTFLGLSSSSDDFNSSESDSDNGGGLLGGLL